MDYVVEFAVYEGLDLENGDFVVIRQVSSENIVHEDLSTTVACYFLAFYLCCFYRLISVETKCTSIYTLINLILLVVLHVDVNLAEMGELGGVKCGCVLYTQNEYTNLILVVVLHVKEWGTLVHEILSTIFSMWM